MLLKMAVITIPQGNFNQTTWEVWPERLGGPSIQSEGILWLYVLISVHMHILRGKNVFEVSPVMATFWDDPLVKSGLGIQWGIDTYRNVFAPNN